jgi:hypothetical protein
MSDSGDPVRSFGQGGGLCWQNCRGNPDEESLQFASGAGFLSTGIAKMRAIRHGFSVPAVPASAFLLCEEMIE